MVCYGIMEPTVIGEGCKKYEKGGRGLNKYIMQSIRAGTQTAPRSAPPVEGSDSGERFSDFQELALRGPPVCARCGAEDGDYGFDCTTKRLICTVCAQNLILSDNDTSWQHLSLQHRKARERMLIGLGCAFHVVEMPEMRPMVVECERMLWKNARCLAE